MLGLDKLENNGVGIKSISLAINIAKQKHANNKISHEQSNRKNFSDDGDCDAVAVLCEKALFTSHELN